MLPMFFRDLKPKPGVALAVTLARVHLPVRLGHRLAEKVFAEPLKRQLAAAGLGTVTECRSQETAPGEVNGVELYLGLTDAARPALRTVAGMLEILHAPHGSSIRLCDGGEPVVFGVTEGLELSVQQHATANAEARRELVVVCGAEMRDFATNRGWATRDDRTVFYFYGESYQRMRKALARVMEANPRFRGAITRRMA